MRQTDYLAEGTMSGGCESVMLATIYTLNILSILYVLQFLA